MRRKRTNNKYTLVKFSGDPVEYLESINAVDAAMTAPAYEMVMDNDTTTCSLAGNIFSYSYNVYTETDTTAVSGESSFCYTPEGVTFYKPLEIAGKEYEGLVFNAEEGTLGAADGKFVINQIIPPLNQLFLLGDWYITYSNLGAFGQTYFNQVKAGLNAIGEELLLAYMGSSMFGKWGFNFYSTDGAGNYQGGLFLNYELSTVQVPM